MCRAAARARGALAGRQPHVQKAQWNVRRGQTASEEKEEEAEDTRTSIEDNHMNEDANLGVTSVATPTIARSSSAPATSGGAVMRPARRTKTSALFRGAPHLIFGSCRRPCG